MDELLDRLTTCIERGKVDKEAKYPADLRDEDGADELTQQALEAGIPAGDVLSRALVVGMNRVGTRFGLQQAFVPDLLMSARAMTAAMARLKPYFDSGAATYEGKIILGTVKGDVHDIGKRLVSMVMAGGGWEVIDLGIDVSAEQFLAKLTEHPEAVIGLSALLTTTMVSMGEIVQAIRQVSPNTIILIGGAPLSDSFRAEIGADFYGPDPQAALEYLKQRRARA